MRPVCWGFFYFFLFFPLDDKSLVPSPVFFVINVLSAMETYWQVIGTVRHCVVLVSGIDSLFRVHQCQVCTAHFGIACA